jgi:hypothetical protein
MLADDDQLAGASLTGDDRAQQVSALSNSQQRRALVWLRRHARIAAVVWTLAVATLTVPPAIRGVPGWLDGSSLMALSLARRMHLAFGSRLLFPYGPYGYLAVKIDFFTREWYQAVAAGLAMNIALVAAIALLLLHRRARLPVWLAATAALIVGLPAVDGLDVKGSLLVVILAFLAIDIDSTRWSAIAAALCGATLALLPLVKLTGIPLVAGVVIITTVPTLISRRWWTIGALLGGLVVAFSALWFSAGLGIADFPRYLHAALDLGSGYTDAMYIGGFTEHLVPAAVALLVFGVLGVGLLARRRVAQGLWLLLALAALFPLFKDGFVRDEPSREAVYFGAVTILAALSLAVIAPSLRAWPSRANLPAVVILAGALAMGIYARSTDIGNLGVRGRLAGYGTVISTMTSSAARTALQTQTQAAAQTEYKGIIDGLPQFSPGATLDVIPWDIGLIYADPALTWDPRPVLQSYTAYTPWLDQQDADFLRSPSAPDFIIYRYQSIDDRYAAFDEPAAFRALLENYRVERVIDPQTILLRRVRAPSTPEGTVGTTCATMGTPVAVPQRPGARMYAHVTVTPSLAGSTIGVLAKSGPVRITLTTPSASADHRLVPSTAADGLLVSSYLVNALDVQAAISGTGGEPITAITVRAAGWAWISPYCVTFTSVR